MSQFAYDAANQLLGSVWTGGGSTNVSGYVYDAAGNRTSERVNQIVTGASDNHVNQLTSQSGGGPVRFQGRVNKPVTNLTVAGTGSGLNMAAAAGMTTGWLDGWFLAKTLKIHLES